MAPLISKIVSKFGFGRSKSKIFAQGGVINVTSGYTYHLFRNPGTFRLIAGIEEVDYLIVGGGGAAIFRGGGGGAGGYRTGTTPVSPSPGIYPIVVGSGGIQRPTTYLNSDPGEPSSAFGIVSDGGGGGGALTTVPTPPSLGSSGQPGDPGGSGGGGGGGSMPIFAPDFSAVSGGIGGSGTPGQGYDGGNGNPALGNPPVRHQGYGGGGGGSGGSGGAADGGSGTFLPPSFPMSHLEPIVTPSWKSRVNTYGLARGGNGRTDPTSGPTPVPSTIYSVPTVLNTGYGGSFPQSPNYNGHPGIVIIRYQN